MKTLLIGVGNMGSALVKGITSQAGSHSIELSILDTDQKRCEETAKKYKVPVVSDPVQGISDADAIILCVKPQGLSSVIDALKGRLRGEQLLISILAGVTTKDLSERFEFGGPVVRVMPNIAATVQSSATVMCHNSHCRDSHKQLVEQIFNSIGTSNWAGEHLLDAVTGLSGSGPAYICMVIEAMTDGGVKMGLSRSLALDLAIQTVAGSAKLAKESGLHPAILKDQVTTPGGTTIHAIHELEAHGLRSMLISAVVTATEKSKSLRENS